CKIIFMEARPNSFPVYVSGQYLTSENLNATQDFLWQEEKASRYLLNGNGIVQGFNVSFADTTSLKQVNISAGDACTVDGYIIQSGALAFDKGFSIDMSWITLNDGTQLLMEKATFDTANMNDVATETIIHATELFSTASNINDLPVGTKTLDAFSITSSQASSNYIALAWVFINDAENDNCVQGDCNTKGTLKIFTTRYFLTETSVFPQQNSANPLMPLSKAARIKNLANSGSAAGFYQTSLTAFKANITELQPYFSVASSGKQLGLIGALLDNNAQASLTNAISKFSQIASSANTNCQQYNNAFASDISTAINELIEFYNEYANKYPLYSSSRIEGVIILGRLVQQTVDNWRYYFIPAVQDASMICDKKILSQLFMRAVSLVNNFVPQSNFKAQAAKVGKIIATPSLIGNDEFAKRAIPYYYDVLTNDTANAVLNTWNPRDTNLQNIFCYYDSIIPSRSSMVAKLAVADWTNENFFRIEGHVGIPKQDAIGAITSLIVNDGLPIQLLDCDVDYKGAITWYNWYAEFSAFLNDSLVQLKSNPEITNYAYDPFKKINTVNLQTSYRQPDTIKGILNDLTSYSGVFYNAAKVQGIAAKPTAKKVSTSKRTANVKVAAQNPVAKPQVTTRQTLAAGVTANSPLSTEVIQNYINIVPQEKITDLVKNYNTAITEVTDPKAKKLLVLKDLAGLEYLGGVPRGGTFILLHSGGTVIGDGCLSYYYRIDQGRIFDL
ncbi:MAG: hypothetical protein ABI405_05315, partial [Parafilimonas sp.]